MFERYVDFHNKVLTPEHIKIEEQRIPKRLGLATIDRDQ